MKEYLTSFSFPVFTLPVLHMHETECNIHFIHLKFGLFLFLSRFYKFLIVISLLIPVAILFEKTISCTSLKVKFDFIKPQLINRKLHLNQIWLYLFPVFNMQDSVQSNQFKSNHCKSQSIICLCRFLQHCPVFVAYPKSDKINGRIQNKYFIIKMNETLRYG